MRKKTPQGMRSSRDLNDPRASQAGQTKRYQLVSRTLRLIHAGKPTADVLRIVVESLAEITGFEAVGIRLRDGDDYPYVQTRGLSQEFIQLENSLYPDGLSDAPGASQEAVILECACGMVLQGRIDRSLPFVTEYGSCWTNSMTSLLDGMPELRSSLRGTCCKEGYESLALVPILLDGQAMGLIQLEDKRQDLLDEDVVGFLEETAFGLAIILSHRQTSEDLRRLNADLDEQVRERTAELRREAAELRREAAERQRAEEALRQSEERFRAIADYTYGWENWIDPQGRLLWVNPAVERISGYSMVECLAMPDYPLPLIHPDDRDMLKAHFDTALAGSTGNDIEFRIVRKDCDIVWAAVSWQPIYDAAGRSLGHRSSVRDITERKRIEEELRTHQEELERLVEEELHRREQEFRALAENAPDPIVRYDRTLAQVYVNPAVERVYGLPANELLHRTVHGFSISEEMKEPYLRALSSVIDTGREGLAELRVITQEGMRHYQFRLTPERSRDGQVETVLAIGRDITALKEMETDLRQAKEEAEAASRAKSEFLANMSHEIRTPMNGIMGMLELGLMSSPDPEIEEYLSLAKQSSRNLLGIINDILDLSKIEAGKLELESREFAPRTMLVDLLRSMRVQAEQKGLRLLSHMGEGVPKTLRGDDGRFRQILVNLIGNAIKFTDSGAIEVRVRLAEAGTRAIETAGHRPESVCLVCSVRDTGLGIPEDKLDRIFEAFSQVGGPEHLQKGGTGLGLSISKRLVELMGGRIWVESWPNRGSTFYFTILLEPVEGEMPRPEQMTAGIIPRTSRGGLILLAEDNPVNRMMTVTLLEKLGHTVTAVEDGIQVIEALQRERFDLVLMDIGMPEMGGEEATRIIRNFPPSGVDPSVPIIALTAFAQKGDRETFLSAGMDDYLAKPIDVYELERVLERYLESGS